MYSYHKLVYRYLTFYAQSTIKGHVKVKQNVFLPQVYRYLTFYTQSTTKGHVKVKQRLDALHPVHREGKAK